MNDPDMKNSIEPGPCIPPDLVLWTGDGVDETTKIKGDRKKKKRK